MHWKALAIGVGGYVALYSGHAFLMTGLANYDESLVSAAWAVVANDLLALVTWLLPAYFAGRVAKQRGLLHGAVVGVVGTLCVSAAILAAFGEIGNSGALGSFAVVFWTLKSAILCSLAAGVGELHAQKGFLA